MKIKTENLQKHAVAYMFISWILLLCLSSTIAARPLQQDEEDSQRRLWNLQFRDARAGKKKAAVLPAPAGPKTNPSPKPGAPVSEPAPAANAPVTEADSDGELIGVTVWRLRTAALNEQQDKTRLLQQEDNLFVPERTSSTARFTTRDRVRLSFEVPRIEERYLYIIDQEVYDKDILSEPYLIFPQARASMRDNIVKAGKIVEIPARADPSPFFDLSLPTLRENRVAERLTVITTTEPLAVKPGNGPTKLDAAQFEQWVKQWSSAVEKRDAKTGAGSNWTISEKEAGEGKRLLLQNDPLPQTIYQIKVAPGSVALFHLDLKITP